jgi:hypothetical protein
MAELSGVAVSQRSLEEILPDAARDFDAFYQQRSRMRYHQYLVSGWPIGCIQN